MNPYLVESESKKVSLVWQSSDTASRKLWDGTVVALTATLVLLIICLLATLAFIVWKTIAGRKREQKQDAGQPVVSIEKLVQPQDTKTDVKLTASKTTIKLGKK